MVELKKAKPGHFIPSRFEDTDGENQKGCGNGNGGGPKRSEAAALKSEYEQKLQAAGKEAYEKGFSEGLEKGADLEREKVQSALKSLAAARGDFEKARRDFIAASEKEVLDLVIAAAECVIHTEVTANRKIISSVLNAALQKILDRDGIRIKLNPDDYVYIAEHGPGDVNPEWLRKSVLVEDGTVSRGGVVIETLFGEVDASVETQLNGLRQALAAREV